MQIMFRDRIRHLLNPLHVFCRLTSLGMPMRVAKVICITYETRLYRHILQGKADRDIR